MKRATVVCAMDPFHLGPKFATPQTVEGYACSIAGIDLVVHRTPRYGDEPSRNAWTVTEPVTGRSVFVGYTRKDAIRGAEETVARQGGSDAVRREIAKHGPAPTEKAAN